MLVIRLIGKPRLERDGVALDRPRGTKSWALLARLVRSSEPVSRQRLVAELFSEADDPMGALRWTLAELRRRTGLAITGNPICIQLGPDTLVDVAEIASGSIPEEIPEGRFLEGIEVRGSATFETWLLNERQRVDSEMLSGLRQATLRALSGRDFERAIALAEAMVQGNPLDEGPHVLLIKALSASGDQPGALRQVEASEAMLTRELGVEPSPALRGAARPSVSSAVPGVSHRAYADSLREAGLAALSAGAADAGVECLRGATAAAESSGDNGLLGECLLELGTALVHSIRGYDDEGSVILEYAVHAATETGSDTVAARALAELAYVDILAGRRLSAARRLMTAKGLAASSGVVGAMVASFDAMNLSDWGKYEEAAEQFTIAIELSRSAGALRREAWALGVGGRTLFMQGQLEQAEEWVVRSGLLVQQERWTAFRPWPEAWGAQIRLAMGRDPGEVRGHAEEAYALARQLQDPCWEAVSAKALGMTYLAQNQPTLALGWMEVAGTSCRRVTDSYRWVDTEVLVTEAEIALRVGDPDRATSLAQRASAAASRGSMEHLLARSRSVLTASA